MNRLQEFLKQLAPHLGLVAVLLVLVAMVNLGGASDCGSGGIHRRWVEWSHFNRIWDSVFHCHVGHARDRSRGNQSGDRFEGDLHRQPNRMVWSAFARCVCFARLHVRDCNCGSGTAVFDSDGLGSLLHRDRHQCGSGSNVWDSVGSFVHRNIRDQRDDVRFGRTRTNIAIVDG